MLTKWNAFCLPKGNTWHCFHAPTSSSIVQLLFCKHNLKRLVFTKQQGTSSDMRNPPLQRVWEAEMERRWSHGPRRWLPPDDSCAVWRYIRADRGHLFPIIQGKMRNWVGNRTRRRCQGAWPEPSSRFVPLEINGQRWLFRKPEQQWKDNVHNEEIAAVRLVMTVNIFTTSARDGGRTETEMRDDVSCSCGSI